MEKIKHFQFVNVGITISSSICSFYFLSGVLSIQYQFNTVKIRKQTAYLRSRCVICGSENITKAGIASGTVLVYTETYWFILFVLLTFFPPMTDNLPEALVLRIKKERVLALPQSAANIMELAKNPENGPAEFAVPISADPGLASQILSFTNSSYFGFRHKITTIQSALSLISVRAIRNFVLWNAVFSLLPNPKDDSVFHLNIIIKDAIRRGIFCKLLASHFQGIDPDEVFIAGLLQDISLPVLVNFFPDDYKTLFLNQNNTGEHLSVLEQNHFGWHHGQVGAFLIDEWGINNGLTHAVESHSNFKEIPLSISSDDLSDIIVKLSSLLPSAINKIWDDAETDIFFELFYKIAVKKFLNANGTPQISSLFSTADSNTAEMLERVKVPKPAISLAFMLQQYSDVVSGTDVK